MVWLPTDDMTEGYDPSLAAPPDVSIPGNGLPDPGLPPGFGDPPGSNTSLLAGLAGLAGGLANAFADLSESDYTAKQFSFNEQIAQIQGQEAILQGRQEQEVSQERTAQLSGQQQASEAAQGVDVSTGTSAISKQQTGEIGAKDYLTIGSNAYLKSLGFEIQAENDKSQSNMASRSGLNKAANSLMGGSLELYQSQLKAVDYNQQVQQAQESNVL